MFKIFPRKRALKYRPDCAGTFCAILLVVITAACSDDYRSGNDDLFQSAPTGLEDLEPAVQRQFDELSSRLSGLRRGSTSATPAQIGQAWGELGQWFHIYRYPDSALRCYRLAVQLDSAEPRWPYYLGMLAVESGDLASAERAFELSLEHAPTSTAALLRLADLKLTMRQPEAAENHLRRVQSLNPDGQAVNIALARLHLQNDDARAALTVLQAMLTKDESMPGHVHYLLAQAYRGLGQNEQARHHLARVPPGENSPPPLVGDDPWLEQLMDRDISSNRLTRLGMRAYRQGNFRAAVMHSGRAARLNPDNPELRTNYAAALLKLERHDLALRQLELALQQDPDLPRAHLVKAGSQLAMNDRLGARDTLLRALELDPNLREARAMLGRVYQLLGEPELAIDQYADMRRRFGQIEQVRFWHAALTATEARHEQALNALSEDLAVLPDSTLLQLLRIRILAAADSSLRRPGQAAELLNHLEVDTPDVYYAETAAMVAAAEGHHELALAWQRSAVEALETLTSSRSSHIARRRMALYQERLACLTPWERSETLITKPVSGPTDLRPSG